MISARPPESRSSVANSWNTRTGSSELSTLTALVSRIRSVERSAAAARMTAGAETSVVGPVMLADPEDVEAHLVGQCDLLHDLPQPPGRAHAVGVEAHVGERVQTDLHAITVCVAPDRADAWKATFRTGGVRNVAVRTPPMTYSSCMLVHNLPRADRSGGSERVRRR